MFPLCARRREASCTEDDMLSDRKGLSLHSMRSFGRAIVGMHANATEILAEPNPIKFGPAHGSIGNAVCLFFRGIVGRADAQVRSCCALVDLRPRVIGVRFETRFHVTLCL